MLNFNQDSENVVSTKGLQANAISKAENAEKA